MIRHAPEMLHIIAEAWEIDVGQVYNKTQYRAVSDHFDLENSHPRCGRAVYPSERRAPLVPEGLPGTHTRTAAAGLMLDLTRGGAEAPTDETIIKVNAALRAAGALEPRSHAVRQARPLNSAPIPRSHSPRWQSAVHLARRPSALTADRRVRVMEAVSRDAGQSAVGRPVIGRASFTQGSVMSSYSAPCI